MTRKTDTASRNALRSHRPKIVVLTGIDGAGKTTAARALSGVLEPVTPTLILANFSGRRTITAWTERLGLTLPPRCLDLAESAIRTANVFINDFRARRFDGVVIMDRHLHCQQALRAARGLPRGRFLAAVANLLRSPDAVVFLDVTPEEAHRRIVARGTDNELLEDLQAYREGYLSLPESVGFHRIPADRPLLSVLDQLEEITYSCQQEWVPASDAVKPVDASLLC